MARTDGIACDFCDKPLTPRPELILGGWNYVWTEMEFESASFHYAACSDCCRGQHDYWDRCQACLKRAGRHSKAWKRAVDAFMVGATAKRLVLA